MRQQLRVHSQQHVSIRYEGGRLKSKGLLTLLAVAKDETQDWFAFSQKSLVVKKERRRHRHVLASARLLSFLIEGFSAPSPDGRPGLCFRADQAKDRKPYSLHENTEANQVSLTADLCVLSHVMVRLDVHTNKPY